MYRHWGQGRSADIHAQCVKRKEYGVNGQRQRRGRLTGSQWPKERKTNKESMMKREEYIHVSCVKTKECGVNGQRRGRLTGS